MIAKSAIGLWGRIHIADCPYCHGAHHHDGVNPGDTVQSECGQGEYTLDCLRISLSSAAPTAIEELRRRELPLDTAG